MIWLASVIVGLALTSSLINIAIAIWLMVFFKEEDD